MTHRRRNALFNDLAVLPWWANLAAGSAAFAAVHFGIPKSALAATPIGTASPYLAWALLLAFAIAALSSAASRRARRKLLEQQTDLDSIRDLPWDDFEHLVGEAYRRLGYHVRETGSDDRHGGADLVLRKRGQTTLVECKRWRLRKVRVATLRELQGVMAAEHAQHGVIVTTSAFTQDARTFALERGIELVDGPQLLRFLDSLRGTETMPPRRPRATGEHRCPHCGRDMVLRTAQKGPKAGSRYWGCTGFPTCKGTRPVGAVIGRSHHKTQPAASA